MVRILRRSSAPNKKLITREECISLISTIKRGSLLNYVSYMSNRSLSHSMLICDVKKETICQNFGHKKQLSYKVLNN